MLCCRPASTPTFENLPSTGLGHLNCLRSERLFHTSLVQRVRLSLWSLAEFVSSRSVRFLIRGETTTLDLLRPLVNFPVKSRSFCALHRLGRSEVSHQSQFVHNTLPRIERFVMFSNVDSSMDRNEDSVLRGLKSQSSTLELSINYHSRVVFGIKHSSVLAKTWSCHLLDRRLSMRRRQTVSATSDSPHID